MPMVAYVGSRPIAKVADAHQQQGDDQHLLAPDPVAEVAEDDAAERPGREAQGVGDEGVERAVGAADSRKKTSPNTRAAAEPKRKKSYHSTAVPIRLAKTTLPMDRSPGCCRRACGVVAGWSCCYLSVVSGVGGHAAVQPPSMKNEEPVIESAAGSAEEGDEVGHLRGLDQTLDGGPGEQDVVEDLALVDAVGAGLVGDLALDQRGADVAGADRVAGDALARRPRGRSPWTVPRGRAWR